MATRHATVDANFPDTEGLNGSCRGLSRWLIHTACQSFTGFLSRRDREKPLKPGFCIREIELRSNERSQLQFNDL